MTATQQRRIEKKNKDKKDKHVRKHVMQTPAGSSELLSTDTVKGEKKLGTGGKDKNEKNEGGEKNR